MKVNVVLTFIASFFAFALTAQDISNSSYSYFGLGNKNRVGHPVFESTGNISGIYADSTILNFYNPASYSLLKPGKILLSTSLCGQFSFLNENDQSSYFPSASLHHIAMAMSVKKFLGISFGLKPYLSKGYSFTYNQFTGQDSLTHQYEGKGNFQQLYFGLASSILDKESTTISLGGNISYLFGFLDKRRDSRLISSATAGGVEVKRTRASSFHYDLGVFFRQKIGNNHLFKIAATLEPSQEIASSFSDALYYSQDINNQVLFDTLFYSNCEGENCNINLPLEVDLSFAYSFRFSGRVVNNKKRFSQITLMAGFNQSDWSNYMPHDGLSPSIKFAEKTQLSFGLSYVPETKYLEKALITKWYERLNYRMGYFDRKLPYTINEIEVHDFGMTFGLGMPIVIQQSLSSLNFSLVLGKRGLQNENIVEENYVGINFGLILSPSNFSRWFRKRKLD